MRRMGNIRWFTFIPALVSFLPFVPMLLRGHVPVLRDHADYFIPLRWFTAQLLRTGSVPHWNALNGLGEPWLANPQAGVLYPPSWLMLVLPFETAYVLWLAIHLAILGTGVTVLAARFASPLAATFTGTAIMFSGPVLSMLDVSNNLASLAWLPWIARAATSDGSGSRRGLLGGIFLALAFLAGEPSFAAIAALSFVVIAASNLPWQSARNRIFTAAASAVTLSAPQLIPFLLSLRNSDRTTGLGADSAFAQSLTLRDLAGLITTLPESGGSQQFVISMMFGPTLMILMGAGVISALRTNRRTSTALLGLGCLLTLLAVIGSTESGAALMAAAKLDAMRHPSRLIVPALVLLTPFAGRGFDVIPRRRSWGIAISAAAALIFALLTLRGSSTPAALSPALDLLALAAITLLASRSKAAAIAGTLVSAHLLVVGSFAFYSAPLESIVRTRPDMRRGSRIAVQSSSDLTLREGQRPPLAGYTNLLAGISKADSPAPVVPLHILRFFQSGIEEANAPALSAASVSRLFSRKRLPLEAADEAGWWKIDPIPLVSGWSGVVTVPDDDVALREFLHGGASLLHATVTLPAPDKVERAPVKAALSPRANGWIVESESERNLVLVIGERAADGWSVRIDGQPAQWFTVNGLMRGVALPAGRHTVQWTYSTPGWRAGWIVFGVGLALGLTLRERRRRRVSSPEERGEALVVIPTSDALIVEDEVT